MRNPCPVPLILALLGLAPALSAAGRPYAPPASPRAVYDFNSDWRFVRRDVPGAEAPGFDDSGWAVVGTPHTYDETDTYEVWISHSGGDRGGYAGIAWYRKHFRLPPGASAGKVFLDCDGLKQAGLFWVNGRFAGLYENGVTPLGLDLTPFVNFDGDNVIAVKVDNSDDYLEQATGTPFEWNGRAFNPNYGGLNHDVRLVLTGNIYQTLPDYANLGTTGVYIYPDRFDLPGQACDVTAESQVRNESGRSETIALSAVVVDASGRVCARLKGGSASLAPGATGELTATGRLRHARWWEPDSPNLYEVYCILTASGRTVDVCPVRTGFRQVEFRGGAGTGGIWLNGKFIYLTGYAQRSTDDWAGLGQAYPDWMHAYNAALVRSSNANYIRWMHIAPQRVDVGACDTYGIVEVCPAGDREMDPAKDRRLSPAVAACEWQQRVEVMRDSMIAFRDDPSIFFWEAGNQVVTPDHMREMVALRKLWDPNGYRVMGVRHGDDSAAAAAVTPIAEYYGVMLAQAPQTDHLATPSTIFRGYSAVRRDRAPLVESEDFRDEAARRFWDDYSPPHFGFHPGPHDVYHWNSESFCLAAAKRYYAYSSNRISNPDPAHSKWSAYASIYWSDSDADGRQDSSEVARVSGKVDSVRLPKEAYFTYQVMQSSAPALHIIGHWTYPAGTRKTVYVAANHCDSVELSVNGRSLGTVSEPIDGYIFAFPNVAFEPGSIRAVGRAGGKVVCRDAIETAGPPLRLRLTVHAGPGGLRADGSDVALIDFEAVDADGRRCPTDEARVDFSVSGPAIWRGGYNSGREHSTNNLYLYTECGINRVSVRSTLSAGTIVVTARRPGLEPASVAIPSQPVEFEGGLRPEEPEGRIAFAAGFAPAAPVDRP